MKKLLFMAFAALCLMSCQDGLWNAINELKDQYSELDGRVTRLEELCKEMNTNISALQTIVNVIQSNDYIVSVTPVIKDSKEIGYVITFGKHEPITIYHGNDGKDGKDGSGAPGSVPVIGVAQDTDGVYYWTLNGEWMLDDNGQKIRVTGKDGKDGHNGQDGQDGNDGADGSDGITPQLKIENDYWYISYDEGTTWTQIGKATGNDGADGQDGQDGQDGDSMFQSVTQDDDYVYFTLSNGQTIKVAKTPEISTEGGVAIVNGAIQAPFSVSATQQVYFSQGNLQYQASTGTWRFALNQYDRIGEGNENISATYEGWIDLFGWGTSGWNSGAVAYQPYSISATESDYYPGNNATNNLTGNYANADWGVYNAISNGGNQAGQWRLLTKDEYVYLLNTRSNANNLKAQAIINYIPGLILFPDNWKAPWGEYTKMNVNDYNSNNYDLYHWKLLEKAGAIFLPACGGRETTDNGIHLYNSWQGFYWSSTAESEQYAWILLFGNANSTAYMNKNGRRAGRSVRLVKDVE